MKIFSAIFLIFIVTQHVQAEENITILKTLIFKANSSEEKSNVVNKEKIENTSTLGDALKHISGIQSTSFGPNSGAPVIRSLSGNRVGIFENGQLVNGMNAISGNINILFDPIFTEKIIVNKNSDSIRYGGNSVGGSVQIESGLISKKIEDKEHKLDIAYRKGFNDLDAKGFKFNINNQNNWATNIRYSTQEISSYKIPGNSKANVCENQVFADSGGVNSALADSCQKDTRIQHIYNKASQPYIDQFMSENPDWADGEFSFYTDKPSSTWRGKTYINPENPKYIPNTPQNTVKKINNDVTPNYYKKLGNSSSQSENMGVGTTYFFDKGYIGLSAERKKTEYGVPGFSMQNQSFQDHYDMIPVGVKIEQNRFALDSLLKQPISIFENIRFNLQQLSNKSGEYLGVTQANEYKIDDQLAEVLMTQKSFKNLIGTLGLSIRSRKIKGDGKQRYLPNINTRNKAIFLQEQLNFNNFYLDVGYRFENIGHEIQDQTFKLARNARNSKLENQSFDLNHYYIGGGVNINDYISLKAKYAISERAPEINELYSSNAHYSVMTQEEGNQKLESEKVKSLELSMIVNWKEAELKVVGYQMSFDNYIYLTHSGAAMANRLPLKYWTQTDTQVTGFEVDATYDFGLDQYGNLKLGGFADLVKNKATNPSNIRLSNDGVYLPNMPTNRYGSYLEWQKNSWSAQVSSTYYAQPKYLGKNVSQEVPLPAYNLVDFKINKNLNLKNASLDIFLNGTNLLNEEARPQNSPLKYIAPLPGRAFQIGVMMSI
ncbi:TonB-dependent receptor [Acinetobacter pittii]|uniref:TonB-dependent receptor n=1 Tax=Acinetobacter pittii TaxID=48296 RepID=UPI001EFD4D10|nr:TonB-dependent receptor [Acinetobacter pittii]MCG9494178.1 TonB-dependent receptor [Acinetobacter pittii]